MKRIIKLTATLLAVLLALTSCSAVFDSAISGTVKDRSVRETSSTSSGGISDVMVYAYDSESDWNNKYSAWDGKSVFTDNSVPSAKTAADGSFSISNLRWMTTSPAYGKDADQKTIYLLAFHKDYGLIKVDGRTIQSDKSNNFGIVYMDKVTATKTLVIKLKDSEDNSTTATGNDSTVTSTSGISFKYKYADGYDGDNQNVTATVDTFTNGQATITVKYKDGSTVPTVTLYDIQTGSDWEMVTDAKTIDCTYSEAKKEYENTSIVLQSKWKTVTVTVDLVDGSSSDLSSVTDPIYFKWAYNNGEDSTPKSGNETTTTGSSSITVKFKKGTTPVLTLSDFDDNDNENDDRWTWTTSETDATAMAADASIPVTISTDKDSVTQKVYFRKNYIKLSAQGIYGYLLTDDSAITAADKASGYGSVKDYGDELTLYRVSDGTETKISSNTVRTTQEVIDSGSSSAIVNYGKFTALGSGVKLKVDYSADESSYDGKAETLKIKYTLRSESHSTVHEVTPDLEYTAKTTNFSVMLYK